MLVPGNGEMNSSLWIMKVLLLFNVDSKGSNENNEHALLLYTVATSLTDLVDEAHRCVWL